MGKSAVPTKKRNNDGDITRTNKNKKDNYEKMIAKMKKRNPDYTPKFKSFEEFMEASKNAGKEGRINSARLEAKRRAEAANRKPRVDRNNEEKD